MRSLIRGVGAAFLGLAAIGCGDAGDGLPREPISGRVTLDGRPLPTGLITFVPAAGGEPIASGVIHEGDYAIDRADGPIPGAHTVHIYSTQPTGKTVKDPDNPGQFVEVTAESIPARYNLRTQLRAEVAPAGANRFEFELTGDTVAQRARR